MACARAAPGSLPRRHGAARARPPALGAGQLPTAWSCPLSPSMSPESVPEEQEKRWSHEEDGEDTLSAAGLQGSAKRQRSLLGGGRFRPDSPRGEGSACRAASGPRWRPGLWMLLPSQPAAGTKAQSGARPAAAALTTDRREAFARQLPIKQRLRV